MIVASALAAFQLLLALLWLPPAAAWLTGYLPGVSDPLWLVLPVSSGAMAALSLLVATKERSHGRGATVHGAALGLHASYLVQTIADATGIELWQVQLDAMDGMSSEVLFRLMFTVAMPAALGRLYDAPVGRVTRGLRKKIGAAGVLTLAVAVGGLLLVAFKSPEVLQAIRRATERYEETLGMPGVVLVPVLVSVIFVGIGSRMRH